MKGKVVITGANRGLGLSQAKLFLEKDYQVIAINRSENKAGQELKDQYKHNFFGYHADVTDETAVEKVTETIEKQHKFIDILINNAAVHTSNPKNVPGGPSDIEQLDFTNILTDFGVNAIGPLIIIKHLLPLVRKGDKKLIVNISSEAGSISNVWRKKEYGYCMSKAALNMASKILQNRLQDENIKVLAIHPGWFSSDMGGEEAPIVPDTAAQHVVDTILQDWKMDDPIYIDAKDGSQMEW